MSLFDRLRGRRPRAGRVQSMDREATPEDLRALREFAQTRTGVELYVEPETMVTDTTVVAVASDGEWTRRRAGSPDRARRLARDLRIPIYDVQIVGYPPRMRAYTKRMKEEGRARMLPDHSEPPVRTQRAPGTTPRPNPPPREAGEGEGTSDQQR